MTKKKIIKQRLEFFDALVKVIRERIKNGEPIPSLKSLIQPK